MEKNLYNITYSSWEVRKNTGFNYSENVLQNSLSKHILSKPTIKEFILRLEIPVTILIDTTKYIKNYFNYTVPKDDLNTPK